MAQDNRAFESSLHDIVYSIDSGTGLKIIRVMLYFLLLLIVAMLYTATQFRGMKSEEAMDYAQLGRNLSLNHGMVTKCVRPLSMWKMSSLNEREDPQIDNHPDLFHPPVYPFVLSMGFNFFKLIGVDPFLVPELGRTSSMPAEQWVILPINHTCTILTGWLIFLLGKRLFSREIGFLGMTIYYVSDVAWADSISCLNISMAGLFVMASFYYMVVAMVNRRDRTTLAKWIVPFVASVVFCALGFLTRYIALAAMPGVALFAWFMRGGFRGGTRYALIFVLLFTVMISPWLYRNYQICGNPMGLAMHTALADSSTFPGDTLSRQLEPTISSGIISKTLKEKWVTAFSEKYEAVVPAMGGGILMAFFLTTFFYHFVRPPVNYLRWGVGVSLLGMLVIGGFFAESSLRMLHVFWPFVILYGLSFFYILVDRLDLGVRLYNVLFKCLIVALACIPLGLTLMPPHSGHPYPPYFSPFISRVSGWLTERETMCTDMPWATAWYGDRVSIQMPQTLEEFYTINDYKRYISGLYITPITKNRPFLNDLLKGGDRSWLPIVGTGRVPPDFPLKQSFQLAGADQMFLSDRDRWTQSVAEPQQGQ